MNYLSEQITSTIPYNPNTYLNYNLVVSPISTFSTSLQESYYGRVYSYRQNQKIYLNDILSTFGDNYSWMSYDNVLNAISTMSSSIYTLSTKEQNRIFTNVSIDYGSTTQNLQVALYNRDYGLDLQPQIIGNWFADLTIGGINILEERTKVLPRIPALNKRSSNFFIGGLFGINDRWNSRGRGYYKFVIANSKGVSLFDGDGLSSLTNQLTSNFTSFILTGKLASGLGTLYKSSNYRGQYITIVPNYITSAAYQGAIKIAQIDYCNADYYVIWVDRTGGYQCQPFTKKSTFKEDIQTTTISSSFDASRPIEKSIKNQWELNSDWLTKDEHKAYESILTSPYTYLYDVKHDKLIPVVCKDSQWVENKSNKPYNLKLNLEENRVQKIVY